MHATRNLLDRDVPVVRVLCSSLQVSRLLLGELEHLIYIHIRTEDL